jgi:methylenetetrahydrofolate dehydrogenase (NADP+) / methenyltetrahydrofolate cyclohydrolase
MLVDGKQIAEDILQSLERERSEFDTLRLGVLMSEGDKATDSFVKIKERIAGRLRVELVRCAPEEMEKALQCDGVIVQLPIPNSDALIAALPPEKDVDALGAGATVRPPVAGAIAEILARTGTEVRGKKAVVVGAGRLVGAPAAALLREMGADVSIITETHGSLEELQDADVVVLGVGEPGLIKPAMLKPGVVLLDAGTSESAGKLAGDADPACATVASVFTPVPGGIGPIAVAMLFKNLFALAKKKRG